MTNANGVPRKLARKMAWAMSMSTAAYGVKAIWEGQSPPPDGFNKLSTSIGRVIAGTPSTAKGEDAIRAADTPPTRRAMDRQRERLLASALAARAGTPKRVLIPQSASDDSSWHRISKWFRGASGEGKLLKEGQQVEKLTPGPRHYTSGLAWWTHSAPSTRRQTAPFGHQLVTGG